MSEAESIFSSPTIRLRLAVPDDAAFIHGLRIDPRYNQHLSAVTGTIADQRNWLIEYKKREESGEQYYFVIERTDDGRRCGTVRIYDIKLDSFCWGSWILNEDKPRFAAVETALLVYEYGFGVLKKHKSVFEVRKENTGVLKFHRRFSVTELGSDEENYYFELTNEAFERDRKTIKLPSQH